jgi:hypothetical protein
MKKIAAGLMVVVAGLLVMGSGIDAGEKKAKEVTLKGSITCGKCDLKVDDKCATVIVVKKGDKETVYYFDKAGDKKYHKNICRGAKAGSVTGVVSKKKDKHYIKVSEVKFD